MIDSKNKIFALSGKRYTYAMYVNAAGYLQHAYWGKKVSFSDIEYYAANIGTRYEPKKGDINADDRFDEMSSEYGFYAHGDFREPSIIIERGDGAAMSRLRYVKHEIYNGAPEIKGMPHMRGGGQTLSVTLKDDFSSTEITLEYTVYDDSGVLVRGAKITNTGKEESVLKKAFSFSVDLDAGDYRLLRLCGNWAAERTPVVSQIEQGIMRLQSLRGASSHQTNPFAAVLGADCTEECGECYGFQLVYSGSFAITAEKSFNGSVRLQGGVNDTNFAWTLGVGECFTAPQALLCYSSKGLGELSRQYADFLREHVINPQYVYKRRPIVVNNWEATYFNFDEQKLFAIIDEAARLGIDTFVLDDGWFGVRNDDTSGLGDWFVNEKKLRGGLQAIIDRCKQNGMKFGLWFGPEGINENIYVDRNY